MESRSNNQNTVSTLFHCECCDGPRDERRVPRREFLATASGAVLGAGAAIAGLPAGRVWAQAKDAVASAAGGAAETSAKSSPESLVKVLYDSLSPNQRETICFPWDYTE